MIQESAREEWWEWAENQDGQNKVRKDNTMKFSVIAGAWIIKDGKVLLLKQRPKDYQHQPNKWGPPAGHGEDNESLEETLRREVKEETNLDIKIEGLVQSAIVRTDKLYAVAMYLASTKNTKNLKIDPDEHQDYAWATLNDIVRGKYEFRVPMLKSVAIRAFKGIKSSQDSFLLLNSFDEI